MAEKASRPKYQQKYCCNCGKWFSTKIDRFLVCSCGITDAVEINAKYGVIDWNENSVSVIIAKTKLDSISISDYADIIPAIFELPILFGEKNKKIMRSRYPQKAINEKLFAKWKAWVVLSHYMHYTNSELYRTLWNKKSYKICEILIKGAVPITENFSPEMIDEIEKLPTEPEELVFATIVNILDGYKADKAMFLAENDIQPFEFEHLIQKAKITEEQAIKDIKEYSLFSRDSSSIINDILQYYKLVDWFNQEVKDVAVFPADDDTPIYLRYIKLKHQKDAIINSGMYALKKLLNCYQKLAEYDEDSCVRVEMYNGLIMRLATIDEIKNNPLIIKTIPLEGVEKIPMVIIRGRDIESVVYVSSAGEILIEGICDDDHKEIANKFLDSLEENISFSFM